MLVLTENGTIVKHVAENDWFDLPTGERVSPAYIGWTNGRYVLQQAPTAPDPNPVDLVEDARKNMVLSFAQLLIGLVTEGWITEAEGRAWLKRELPASVVALIATLPPNQQFAATARATDPSYVRRTDPLVIALATSQGKSATQLDAFFTTYANV